MEKVPLAIRRGLRDDWEKPEAPARLAIAKLSELLGLEVSVDLDITMLWTELQKYFPDKDVFIPTIIGIVREWVVSLTERLEEDSNAQWTDQLLEYLGRSGHGCLRAKVETAGNNDVWTNVTTAVLPRVHREENTRDQSSGVLPSLDTLPRPERLFEALEPYHLIVKIFDNGMIVQSSHQPSLELLAGYLRKYTKSLRNATVKVPEANVELRESKYGLGSLLDSLSITYADNRSTNVQNPVLILAFVEGVLGYKLVTQCCTDSQWYFRKGSI